MIKHYLLYKKAIPMFHHHTPQAPAKTAHALDNPVWSALQSRQSAFALGDHQARRFPQDISPLAGIAEQSPEAYHSLATLAEPPDTVVLFLQTPSILPAGWLQTMSWPTRQMVLETSGSTPGPKVSEMDIQTLGVADVPDMLALTQLTQPGPFRPQTLTLGTYLGIRESGRLAAMAGERLRLDGYTEISAVCTHPDFRGKGYAPALVRTLIERMTARNETPFLHVRDDNAPAIAIYEALGFRKRRLFHGASLHYMKT
jgi:predicted GNAT family acetyltransferase